MADQGFLGCSDSKESACNVGLFDNRFSMLPEAETDVDPLVVWQGCRDDGTVAPPFIKMVLEEDRLGNTD